MPVQIKDAIVVRFQELCKQRNMKYNELANISGVTPSTVYSMMDGTRRNLSVSTVKKLCDGLDIGIPDFFAAKVFYELEQELN